MIFLDNLNKYYNNI